MDGQYDKLRVMVRELVEFIGLQQTEICHRIDWSPASMSRFLKGEQVIYYAQGRELEDLYNEHADVIRQRKIDKGNKLLESAGAQP
jgi:hypothetical protein